MDTSKLFIGRVGRDPELKYTQDQVPVCYLNLAETIKGFEKPLWHKVVVWGKQAELCKVFLTKGTKVFVQGRIKNLSQSSNNNQNLKYEEITADHVGFINL
jgi:single-strand DNA-binding protein